jgi:hypothetical protein
MNKPDMFADPEAWEADLIHRLTGNMARQADEQQSADKLSGMYDSTEREVFWDTFATGDQDVDAGPYEGGHGLLTEASQIDGWDGLPVSDAEGLARAMQGDEVDGYIGDRPLQHQHELEVDQQNQHLRQQVEAERAARQATEAKYSPQIQAQQQEALDAFSDQNGFVITDMDRARPFLQRVVTTEQSVNALVTANGEESMQRARHEYDRDFDDTYLSLQQMDQRQPRAREIMQQIKGSRDPGLALMNYHGSDEVAALGVGNYVSPPFAPGRAVRGRVDRVHVDEDNQFNSGYGDADTEAAVLNSAFED